MKAKLYEEYNNDITILVTKTNTHKKTVSDLNIMEYKGYNNIVDEEVQEQVNQCRSLWRAVITQALMDIGSNSKRTEDKLAKEAALNWFFIDNKDFEIVCRNAEYLVDYVRKKAYEAVQRGCKWRADTRSSKNIFENIKPYNINYKRFVA